MPGTSVEWVKEAEKRRFVAYTACVSQTKYTFFVVFDVNTNDNNSITLDLQL